MRIIAVMDLMGGVVVHGVRGRREDYRPLVSRLTSSCDPLDVAEAFRSQLGLDELYVADLDAIAGLPTSFELYRTLHRRGFKLWVDAGLRRAEDAVALYDAGTAHVVAGLETLAGPEELERLDPRCVFSLDLKAGRPLAAWADDPLDIVRLAVEKGVRRILVLDLASVGSSEGTGTEELCRRMRDEHAGVEVIAGGGVRGQDDLNRLQRIGLSAVLVASALHDGRLSRETMNE